MAAAVWVGVCARVRVVSVASLHSSLSRSLVERAPRKRCDVILWLRSRHPSVSRVMVCTVVFNWG